MTREELSKWLECIAVIGILIAAYLILGNLGDL